MATTVEQIARAAMADLAEEDAGIINGARWVSERYAQLAGRRLKQRRQVGELLIPAAVTAGLATATQGSTAVTGDATAQAAWTALGTALEGRYFTAAAAWYKIQTFVAGGGGSLTLNTAFGESTVTAGAYKVVQRYTALDTTAGFLGPFVHARLRREVNRVSHSELDVTFPDRLYSTGGPLYVAEFGENATGTKIVEFYPYSTTAEHILYIFWSRPINLALTDNLPGSVDLRALKEGVLVDVMKFKMSRAAVAADMVQAEFWRQESHAQEGRWYAAIQELVKRDHGIEDLGLILQSRFFSGNVGITNARDEIYARGNRP